MANERGSTVRRLNPFVFPSETNVRFTLLIVTAVSVAIAIAGLIFSPVIDSIFGEFQTVESTDQPWETNFERNIDIQTQALLRTMLHLSLILAFVLGVLGIAVWLFRSHPSRIRRRRKLKPISRDKDPDFVAAIEGMANDAGISPCPSIEVDQTPLTDGQAFGLAREYVIRVGGRMALQMRRSPHRFRAVIKHELGHIVNKDVWRTYFTQALWSTVLLALSVFIAFFSLRFLAALWRNLTAVIDGTDPNWFDFFRFRLPLNLWFTLQTLGLLALFHSIRISVLRAREVYADWRAVLQGGESGMREILSQQVEKPIGWWQRIFAVHPHPSRRLALLDNPDSLFKLSADLPLYVGVMLGTAFNGIMMTGLELSGAFTFGLGLFMDVVLVGPVIAGETQVPVFILSMMLLVLVIGMIALIVVLPVGLMYIGAQALSLQTQRSLIVGLRDKAQTGCASLLRLGPSAVTLAVGIQLGLFLAPASITTPVTDIILHEGSMLPALLIPIESMLWLLAFTLSIWVWLAFARLLATVGLGAHTGKEPPRRKMRLMTLALGLLLSMISVPAMMAQMWIYRNFGGLASVGAWDFRGILLATIVVVVLGVVFAIAVWMALEAWAKLSQRRCPQCSHKVSQRIVIGKVCPNCRTELAPWIYVEASA